MNDLVTIIVPVYNAAGHIDKCITSLLNQTLVEMEIILVDDGSTDKSPYICQEYSKSHSNVSLIRQENGGVSSARNTGIKHANGNYIGFVDSDDWINDSMYESMLMLLRTNSADACFCNYTKILVSKSIPINFSYSESVFDREEILDTIIPNIIGSPSLDSGSSSEGGLVCQSLFRKDIIDRNNIQFNEDVSIGEDLLFTIHYLSKSSKLVIDKSNHYNYLIHGNSTVTRFNPKKYELLLKRDEYIKHCLNKNLDTNLFEHRLDISYVKLHLSALANIANNFNKESIFSKLKLVKKVCKDSRLKEIILQTDRSGFSIRKKLILFLVLHELNFLVYVYYRLLNLYYY